MLTTGSVGKAMDPEEAEEEEKDEGDAWMMSGRKDIHEMRRRRGGKRGEMRLSAMKLVGISRRE